MAVESGRESGGRAGRVGGGKGEGGAGRDSWGRAGRVGSWHPRGSFLGVVGSQGNQEGCSALLTAAMI